MTEAEILTDDGWKAHDEVIPGDRTLGYNPETGRSEWTTVRRVVHYEDAPIVHMYNARVGYRSTPNHRWLTEERNHIGGERMVEARNLRVNDRLRVSAVAMTGDGPDITDAEAALIGWLLSDGTLRAPGLPDGLAGVAPVGCIYQSKPENFPVIEKTLHEATGGDFGHSERPTRGIGTMPGHTWRLRAPYVRDLVDRAEIDGGLERMVSLLSPSQRRAFLDAVKIAEGTPVMYGETELWRIPQVDGPKMDAFLLAAYLEGHKPLTNVLCTDASPYAATAKPTSQVTLASPTVGVQSLTFEADPDLHDVWCVETDLGTWTARDQGQVFLTGNSLHGPIEPTVQGQAQWGLNYIRGAYGNPLNAYQQWSNRSPHWYDDGDILPQGLSLAYNGTGQRERVLDPRTTRNFEMLTRSLNRATQTMHRPAEQQGGQTGRQRLELVVEGHRFPAYIVDKAEDVYASHASHGAGLSRLGAT